MRWGVLFTGQALLRDVFVRFAQEEIKPNIDEWIEKGYPRSLHEKAYEAGIQVS